MESAKKGLLNGMLIYFVGNGLVMALQLVMLKFITGNIQPEGYGYYNIIVTIDNLVTPILTLQISDAIFRFVMKGDKDQQITAFTDGMFVIAIGIVLTVTGVAVVAVIADIDYPVLVAFYIISTNIFAVYQKMARALGKNVEYVKSNLLKAFLYLLLQVVFIYKFQMKADSLFLATIISTFACIILIEVKVHCFDYFRFHFFNLRVLKKMIWFSIPLVPNTLLWWLSGSVNSIAVTTYLGMEANGIYTIAGKFAGVLSTITSIFNLAWQESAIREYGKKGSQKFYSDVFQGFFFVVIFSVSLLIPAIYILMPLMIDKEYYSALIYAPILVVGTGISALYGFFGQMYAATAKTKGAFTTTLFGVIANSICLMLLIRWLDLLAPCIATVFSAAAILYARWKEFHKEMSLHLPKYSEIAIVVLAIGFINYYVGNLLSNVIFAILVSFLAVVFNKSTIRKILKTILSKFKVHAK